MMSHMATPATLLEEAKKMESYGAQAIVIMDSAGAYFRKTSRSASRRWSTAWPSRSASTAITTWAWP